MLYTYCKCKSVKTNKTFQQTNKKKRLHVRPVFPVMLILLCVGTQ